MFVNLKTFCIKAPVISLMFLNVVKKAENARKTCRCAQAQYTFNV